MQLLTSVTVMAAGALLAGSLVAQPTLSSDTTSTATDHPAKTSRDYEADFRATDYEYCLTCHGSQGQGNPVIEAPVLAGMASWSLRNQLEAFRLGWRGQHPEDLLGMEMYPMATELSAQQVPEVIAAITTMSPQSAGTTLAGDVQAGQTLYESCVLCHGARAEGQQGLQAPALAYQSDWYLTRQLRNFRDSVRGAAAGDSRGAIMMAAAAQLSDDDINNIVVYIKTLAADNSVSASPVD